MNFQEKPIIGVIHLLPLLGSPLYDGNFNKVINTAIREAKIYQKYGIHSLIIENFRDAPFFKDNVPAETIAAMTSVSQEIKRVFEGKIGINVLRNDAQAAMAIATAIHADFIRVNVHIGAAVTDQGIIEGRAAETLRLRKNLYSKVNIFTDVAVKHAAPLGFREIEDETSDLSKRGFSDAIIVSGNKTGDGVDLETLSRVKASSTKPVLLGSGVNMANIKSYLTLADGFIVGSYFKTNGKADNFVEEERVENFMKLHKKLVQDL